MYISPEFIEKSIINRLRIKNFDQCDKFRDAFPLLNISKKRKKRYQFPYQYN